MQTRRPIVAGQFYPAQHDECVDEINECIEENPPAESLPQTITAGIVPHAGWVFSGSLAVMVFSAIKQQHEKVHTFVIFGAAHGYFGQMPAVYDKGSWTTPLGETFIDEELAERLLKTDTVVANQSAHRSEHSIEVQVPFIQYLFAGSKILPVIVPPAPRSIKTGEALADIIAADKNKKIVAIGSTDLTHYGPRYNFTPMGTGSQGLLWAGRVNDKSFIDLALELKADELLASAAENGNACGPGAAAATISFAKKLGKKKGILLAHTTSNDVMMRKMRSSSQDSVGYAAMIF